MIAFNKVIQIIIPRELICKCSWLDLRWRRVPATTVLGPAISSGTSPSQV
jgi:hypothetical protein